MNAAPVGRERVDTLDSDVGCNREASIIHGYV